MYRNGTMTDIGTLGGPNSSVNAINDSGVVAGSSQDSADVPAHYPWPAACWSHR